MSIPEGELFTDVIELSWRDKYCWRTPLGTKQLAGAISLPNPPAKTQSHLSDLLPNLQALQPNPHMLCFYQSTPPDSPLQTRCYRAPPAKDLWPSKIANIATLLHLTPCLALCFGESTLSNVLLSRVHIVWCHRPRSMQAAPILSSTISK